jgi:L-alanine-DL-glutamate epimerase-like enolase superfamily enzyme
MKITAIRDIVVPIKSSISNAFINFSEMTVSAVAVHTDVIRNGKPVVGFGFHSNGRYAQQGILRERMIPRLLNAPAASLLNESGTNIDPERAWAVMMTNEKPGGHGDRSVAVGTLDMALWDAAAKIENKPLYQALSDRYRDGHVDRVVSVYAAGGYYYPGKDNSALVDEMRSYLDLGYTRVKMKIGGAPLSQDRARIEAVLKLLPSGDYLCLNTRTPLRPISSTGTRSRVTRSISSFWPRWPRLLPLRSPPARTCFRRRTPRTCFVTAD